MRDRTPDERDLYYNAAACLTAAYKELGHAADDLRDLASPAALLAIAEAKAAINLAKGEIGA